MTLSRIVPPPIAPGAGIAMIAPASSPTAEQVAAGVADLEQGGYRVKVYRPLSAPVGYLSGTDEVRAAEVMQAFTDNDVSAVFAARGGYGVARLLDRLDFDVIRANPKPLVGYSDLTALHAALDRHARLVSYHAPNAIDGLCGGGKLDPPSVEAFWQAVAGEGDYLLPTAAAGAELRTVVGGVAEGELVGGNLAVLAGLIGTPYEPELSGRVLLLEDLDEQPYRLDRMLAQLRLTGGLDSLAGVLLGQFTNCGGPADGTSPSADELLEQYFGGLGVPVLAGFPTGHTVPNLTLPHAGRVRLDADSQRLTVLRGGHC
ncbi:putative murein peptide carboxypeptidase [Posidoniimonas polymericola]|uniref:Putative murein peptide carboxypeptidase n=1 Tax=Posidoniimonas polymericola TaxID=2528002 RepID=A0A5C5YV89_9BACT|nr:LD-carboxypeptidase [Posidoniimonas polymericola]TWT78447.1 putative murein peptide carboxypeptidase [Posidoniimonas polymericola]